MAVKRQDIGKCPVCGRALSKFTTHVKFKDAENYMACRDCENKLRVMYPLVYGKKKNGTKIRRLDPLEQFTLEQFKEEMKKAPEYLENLRERYGFDAVYKVDDIAMAPHGWFSPPLIYAKGRTIYGIFEICDKVRVIRRGAGINTEIKDINRQHENEKDIVDWLHRAEGGYPCDSIVLSQKGLIVAPGDLIVK